MAHIGKANGGGNPKNLDIALKTMQPQLKLMEVFMEEIRDRFYSEDKRITILQ
ncbi:uncharacterized protein G2W53_033238 [Senna tora]|uniref:Uncharacterized protein n=1 Tax=Senna tora TaxID=362788 RepID=A0A834SZR7_9FABA|nr:uncharacterized protein G2W53_033238 [Senna tora]